MAKVIVDKPYDIESVDKALAILKHKLRKDDWYGEMNKRQSYTKPSLAKHTQKRLREHETAKRGRK